MKKRVLSLLLVFAIGIGMMSWFSAPATAQEITADDNTSEALEVAPVYAEASSRTTAGGQLTETIRWSYADGKLTISGTGAMEEWQNVCPWEEYRYLITSAEVEEGITFVSAHMFYAHENLRTVIFADSVTGIGEYAFEFCYELQNVVLPKNLKVIEKNLFVWCGLQTLTIPAGVTTIRDGAFAECPGLTAIWVDENNPYFSSDAQGKLFNKNKTALLCVPKTVSGTYQVPKTVTELGYGAFAGCADLLRVELPEGLTTVGPSAFSSCSNLQSIEFPKTVAEIGDGAFFYCDSLQSVTIPERVTRINNKTFFACGNLQSIVLHNAVTEIDDSAFDGCTSLTSVTIPDSVTSIGDYAFSGCSSLTSVTIPDRVTAIGGNTFWDCSSLTSVTIPDSVTTIGRSAFSGCSSLTSVTIPDSVTTIGRSAFSSCSKLSAVNIPEGVTSIGEYAFSNCSRLTTVNILDGVVSIDRSVFRNCSSLTSVTIPDSVTSVGSSAFGNCSSLTNVYYGGTEEQWEQISIGSENDDLLNATVYFNMRSFRDVNITSWQYAHVQYALQRNLMAGKGTDAHGNITFDPNSPITREEFVQVLYNAEGKPAVTIANPFPDVLDTGWYKNAVLWAKENNIANGGGDGNFGVGAKITRQDLALMLYKYAVLKNCSLETDEGITDQYGDKEKISGYAKQALDWAVTNGILSGKGTAGQPLSTFRLDPTGTATRAECAAMLRNFMTAFNL